jgi:glycosyltransferase involved in cell wall biosynthesis
MKLFYAFPEPLPLPRARGVQVAHAVASLANAGIPVDFAYVPVVGESPFSPLSIGCYPDGVRCIPISRGWPSPLRSIPPFSGWHSTRFFATRLRREIHASRPDWVYVRHLKLAALLLRTDGMPRVVYEAHEVFADTASSEKSEQLASMERLVVHRAAAVICNTKVTADGLVSRYGQPNHLLVLGNGAEIPQHLPEKPWETAKTHIVYTGSFFKWKGVDDLVAAAAALPDYRITLIGGEADQIERLKKTAPLQGAQLDFVPRVSHAEVMRRLAGACIAVLPNRPDTDSAYTSPIKLFEYMGAGCAIIVADLPSIREVLERDDAIWFRAGDSEDLARALSSANDDVTKLKALGARVREKSKAHSWQARAETLATFLTTLPP